VNIEKHVSLCVIDCYSKYAWCEKLKTKTGQETARAFEEIFNKGKKGKVFPYSLPSVGPGADPGVQAVSPQVT